MKTNSHLTHKRLEHIFEVLGLNKHDLKVYCALIDFHRAITSQVASHLKLPRQTALSILLKLHKVGLVTLSSRSGVKLFIADPENLPAVLKRKHEELNTITSDIHFATEQIRRHRNLHFRKPTVKYYEGSHGLKNLFQSMLEYYEQPGSTKEFRGYGINTYKEASVRIFLSHFIKKRKKLGVTTKLLVGAGPEDFTHGKAKQLNISIQHMDTPPQNAGMYILEDKVYLFSFTDNAGLVVINKTLARFLKQAFDDHWHKSHSLKIRDSKD